MLAPSLRFWVRQLAFLPLELCDLVRGRQSGLVPPRWLRFVGRGDFVATGQRFVRLFQEWGHLRSTDAVLDAGCGCGRMALPLTELLVPPACYEGFDVLRPMVRWCQRHITPRWPHFRFQHVDLANGAYNPHGRRRAADFAFPYADARFDFAFLTSVFTHLSPADVHHYLVELRRVVRPGGRCFATFFLLNDEARRRMNDRPSLYCFCHPFAGAWADNPRRPEAALAYEEAEVQRLLAMTGWRIERIEYGSWCGRPSTREGQDVIIAVRDLPNAECGQITDVSRIGRCG